MDGDMDGGDAMVAMAGVTLTPTAGLRTSEGGEQATFTIVLDAQPTAEVTIALSSSDEGEGTVSPLSVTFTMDNWSAPQTVTITGIDDDIADGDQTYNIVTSDATSDDAAYGGMVVDDVEVTNTDDETAGITVDPTSGLTTTEMGGSADFTVVLNTAPTADVTIPLSSSDEGEGTVSPASLTFTMDNWSAPQTVTVTGVDDDVVDGDQVYNALTGAATSTDAAYDGLDADDVELTNTDDETAGITVDPLTGSTTTEAGGSADVTVVLNSAPSADVTIPVSSSDEGEGTVSPDTLTFTMDNWNAPQTITVTGVDDAVADGAQVYQVVLGAATSTDTGYDGVDPDDAEVTNTDDDSAGITVAPVDGLSVSEAGTTDSFTVVLNSRPTADVNIGISSSDDTEGTALPASLTFTMDNWNAPQTVTVTGVDDAVQDGNQVFRIQTAAATSTDTDYDTVDAADVEVTNTDNDSAGVTVTALTTPLVTTEAGGTDTFTVVLNTRPTADVDFAISSDDTTEGTVGPATLTFTTANWNAPQTVTVTGVDDSVQDGNQVYNALVGAATSTDANYTGMDPPDVAVSNTDNDSAGFTVTPTTGLVTTEAGGTDSFDVVLNSQPTAIVTVAVSSSDTGEGTVSTALLTFTTVNWNAPQTVTITGVSDGIFDGDQPYTIALAPATSTDAGYSAVDPTDVSATNMDQDPGVSVTPTTGLVTTEAGGTASFDVVLNVAPTANVDITFASSNTAEGTIGPAALTFTTANWNAPQTITVTGVDDFFADGDQSYTITNMGTSSTQTAYDSLPVDSVSVVNQDDETAGIQLSAPRPRETTEAGGSYVFKLRLRSEPTANVTVPLATSDATEGTVSPSSLTFTAGNWNSYQSVTATGVDDLVADGNQPYTVRILAATSADSSYNGLDRGDVGVTNIDNETAGFEVSPLSITTREDGTSDTFQVRLRSEPSASVTISVATDDTGEGVADVASLTFTTLNWNSFQTVTATGVDDLIADGDQTYHIVLGVATSADTTYAGINPADVTATNVDDDSPGITVVPTSGLTTSEVGGSAHFDIFLDSQPTANVTIAISSSDTTEGAVDPASLTFTTANWNAPQVVTVTGQDDFVADGNVGYTLFTAAAVSADSGYNGLNAADVSATNTDDETAGVTVTPITGLSVTESGGTDSFSIVLDSQPTASVTIGLSSGDTTEGSVSPAFVTFTSANWNAPQTVTVTGVDDALADGDQTFSVLTADAVSGDANYSGFVVDDVTATCVDDETAGVTVTAPVLLNTTETGSTDTFTIKLNSEPFNPVTINLSSSDTSEGTVSPISVTFTAADWNAPQTITATGVDDFVADGNQPYSIITSAAVSVDLGYDTLSVDDVPARNRDNEVAGLEVVSNTGLLTNESGTVTGAFRVRLLSQPIASVTVPFFSVDPDEADTTVPSIVFNATNWNVYQSVTVTGIDDFIADGNQPFTIDVGLSTSSDPNYMGLAGTSVTGVNLDDETPGITVTPSRDLVTSESGTTDAFDVVLNSQPTAAVVISFSWDNSEGSLDASSLTFTPANWSTVQTVIVTGVPDGIVDGSQAYNVVGDPSGSADALYAAITAFSVRVINTDID